MQKSTRKQDGGSPGASKFYVLKMDRLRPADVILTASPGQFISGAIRSVTGSSYSHAILALNDLPYACESADWGVVKFRLDRFAVRDPSNLVVRRLRASERARFDASAAIYRAEQALTAEYAERDMLTALFSSVAPADPGKFFCSQLVAEAYQAGGVAIAGAYPPAKVTPGMLAATQLMEDVEDVLEPRTLADQAFEPAWLDGPNAQSPAEAETDARQQIIRIIAPVFARFGLSPTRLNDALDSLCEAAARGEPFVAELDEALSGAIMRSGLLAVAPTRYPSHTDEFFVDLYVHHEIVNRGMPVRNQLELLRFYQAEVTRMTETNAQRDAEDAELTRLYLQSNLESVRLSLAVVRDASLLGNRLRNTCLRAIARLEHSLGIT